MNDAPGLTSWSLSQLEANHDHKDLLNWMGKNVGTSFYWVAAYVILVFGGQKMMNNRPAFKLKMPLFLWSASLALFSIMGTIKTWPEMYYTLKTYGFHHSVCSASWASSSPAAFWFSLFTFSKVPELGDTLFIVLRKRPLIFLHWYHHITVLWLTWYTTVHDTGATRYYVDMNFFVHSLMYSYYALRAIGIKLPKVMAIVITSLQILQMIVGAFVTFYAFFARSSGCDITANIALAGIVIYTSYLVLFVNFFIRSYFKPNSVGSKVNKCDRNNNLISTQPNYKNNHKIIKKA